MRTHIPFTIAAALLLATAARPTFADTQDAGEAAAAKVNIQAVTSLLGTLTPAINTAIADTGTLTSNNDMRQASGLSGSVTSVFSGETLHAVTAAAPDEVLSEASLSNLGLNLAGNTIGASFVMAKAIAPSNGTASGSSAIEGLLINGSPVNVTGDTNQVIQILGGRVVLNEQQLNSDGSMVVNAIHITINGVADVVVASARAGVGSASSGSLQLPLLVVSGPITAPAGYTAYFRPLSAVRVQTKRFEGRRNIT